MKYYKTYKHNKLFQLLSFYASKRLVNNVSASVAIIQRFSPSYKERYRPKDRNENLRWFSNEVLFHPALSNLLLHRPWKSQSKIPSG